MRMCEWSGPVPCRRDPNSVVYVISNGDAAPHVWAFVCHAHGLRWLRRLRAENVPAETWMVPYELLAVGHWDGYRYNESAVSNGDG